MKKILFFLIIFFSFICNAQLDKEHWFAPMVDRTRSSDAYQALYFSTNETTAFPVSIYNNNRLIGTVTISKGNPQKFVIPTRDQIITTQQSQVMNVTSMGFYVKADKKFFANLRFSVNNHAEIITSKGLAGIGTKFYSVMAPITVSSNILNFMTSIIATENNTTVTVSGFSPTVVFSDGTTGRSSITIHLDKGQSYIFDGNGNNPANWEGFIGAKIESDKPISVTNGNFNGQYAGNYGLSSDILMDQSLPVDRLGSEFAIIKGNGLTTSNMEQALVVACANNTQIYVNGSTTPIKTLNEGEHFLIDGNNYINQGSNHYNLYIKTSQNVYVYQLLAGFVGDGTSGGNDVGQATGGFNCIPSLNCFLPNNVGELGAIDENEGKSGSIISLTKPTKLNIIAQSGANIKINGTAINSSNSNPITGTSDWVTYSIPNVQGNITIDSDRPVTAGIAAGSDAVGYAGYFAGFSTVPAISKTGDCSNGILLEVDNSFDAYQWYLNGALLPSETNSYINPERYGKGDYTCLITKSSCTSRMTSVYTYTACPLKTTSIYNIGSCNPLVIVPRLTSSTQTVDISKTSITARPLYGTVNVDPVTGNIIYNPNNITQDTTDSFTYYLQGTGSPVDSENVTVQINIQKQTFQDTSIIGCPDSRGTVVYDLTTAMVTSYSGSVVAGYYENYDPVTATFTGAILNPNNYSSLPKIIYAQIKSMYGCIDVAKITLKAYPFANLDTTLYNAVKCDDNFDGIIDVKFSTDVTPIILQNSSYFKTEYSLFSDFRTLLPDVWTYGSDTQVYVRVLSPDGCLPILGQINFKVGNKITLITTHTIQDICDPDLSGTETFKLSDYKKLLTTDTSLSVKYYNILSDAQDPRIASLSDNQTLTKATSPQTFYYRFEGVSGCPVIGNITFNLVNSKRSNILTDKTICPEAFTTLDAGVGFDYYKWSTGEEGANVNQINNVKVGDYWVDLSLNGCVYRQTVKVLAEENPVITNIDITGSTVIVTVTGSTPPYQYSLDRGIYQSSNIFTNVSPGIHNIQVLSSNGCAPVSYNFSIIRLLNVITPNGDGYNDKLNYSDLRLKEDVSMYIFDRYGKKIFDGSSGNNYTWDGYYMGKILPTQTYWYLLKWTEPLGKKQTQYSGWILLKND